MSNRVSIMPTIFENARDHGISRGIRMYDDYDMTYDNGWDDIPDDDMEVLRRVRNSDDPKIEAMLDNIAEGEKGVYIGDNWYDWNEIKTIINRTEGCCED